MAVPTDQDKRKRAAKRRLREAALRGERERALVDPGAGRSAIAAVSVAEFKKLTGASHATVSRWVKSGALKSTKTGRRRFIAFSEVERIRGQ
jgi:excisionase family DNA binding protein